MDKLNEWTKDVIAWVKEEPATAILTVVTTITLLKMGKTLNKAIIEASNAKSQS